MTPKDSTSSNGTSKLGRKGDPRMHRAVAARLSNPELPLVDALREGGFHFPTNESNDTNIEDADGVTLGQRKNQLSRRLRLAKQSLASKKGQPTKSDPSPKETTSTAKKRGAKRASAEALGEKKNETPSLESLSQFNPRFYPPLGSSGPGPLNVTHASGVAMASLISTAASVGMTLEQLALRLANTPTLFQSLASNPDPNLRLQLALSLYQVDSRALLQKCMLISGYEGSESVEGSASYMQVALKMWEAEGKRLGSLLGNSNGGGEISEFCERFIRAAKQRNTSAAPDEQNKTVAVKSNGMEIVQNSEIGMNCPFACNNMHGSASLNREEKGSGTLSPNSQGSQGRHVHRLSGKCGHKAILHQPPGKPAHIDFVVDGKIECYEGIKPVGPKGQGALWPSRHKCIDLACPTDPTDPNKVNLACGSNTSELEISHLEAAQSQEPKQLALTDVDFDGKEWNVDFFSHDGQDDTLLGLIKLGDGDKKEEI